MEKHTILRKYILGLSQNYATSLIVNSPAGLGKTETTIRTLKELGYQENVNYRYVSNYITPVELFLMLEEVNKLQEPRLLILDDCEDTLKNERAIGLLKGALWETDGKRRVSWISGTYKVKDKEMEFQGRIVFLVNKINEKSPIMNALKDRGFYYHFNLSQEEKISLIRERAKLPYQGISYNKRQEIVSFLEKVGRDKPDISLRLLPKAFQLYLVSPNHYQTLILSTLYEEEKS